MSIIWTPSSPSDPQKQDPGFSRRSASIVGLLVALGGSAFVVKILATEWGSITDTVRHANPAWLAGGLGIAALAMVGIASPWRNAMQIFGHQVGRMESVCWYFTGEIGKYIPGAIWPIVGRAELARRVGVPRPVAYGATAVSLGAAYIAAMLVAVFLIPFDLHERLGEPITIWVLALLPLTLLGLHHRVLEALLTIARRVLQRELAVEIPRWRSSIVLVLRYVPGWFLVGWATWLIARGLDPAADLIDVAFAAVLSWVAGFLVIPAPGGIGVREAVFIAAAGLPAGIGAATAIAARLGFIIVDAVGATIAGLVLSLRPAPVSQTAGHSTDDPAT